LKKAVKGEITILSGPDNTTLMQAGNGEKVLLNQKGSVLDLRAGDIIEAEVVGYSPKILALVVGFSDGYKGPNPPFERIWIMEKERFEGFWGLRHWITGFRKESIDKAEVVIKVIKAIETPLVFVTTENAVLEFVNN
jgi:hypothetical protein